MTRERLPRDEKTRIRSSHSQRGPASRAREEQHTYDNLGGSSGPRRLGYAETYRRDPHSQDHGQSSSKKHNHSSHDRHQGHPGHRTSSSKHIKTREGDCLALVYDNYQYTSPESPRAPAFYNGPNVRYKYLSDEKGTCTIEEPDESVYPESEPRYIEWNPNNSGETHQAEEEYIGDCTESNVPAHGRSRAGYTTSNRSLEKRALRVLREGNFTRDDRLKRDGSCGAFIVRLPKARRWQ